MAASDALIVGEDWISEHYFTTDAEVPVVPGEGDRTAQGMGRGRKTVREDGDSESKVDTYARDSLPPAEAWARTSPPCSPTRLTSPTPNCPTCTPASAPCSATTPVSTRQAG